MDALQALADVAGLPLDAYLAQVAEEKRRERALDERRQHLPEPSPTPHPATAG